MAYSPPSTDAIDFEFESYSQPGTTSITFDFTDKIIKSASATKVASSSTQSTAQGSITETATASTTSGTSTPTTPTASSQTTPSPSTVAGTASPTIASGTSSTASTATGVTATASMSTPIRTASALATTVSSTTSSVTQTGTPIGSPTPTQVASSASMQSPSTIVEQIPAESNFSYVGTSGSGLYKYNSSGTVEWSDTSIGVNDITVDADGTAYVTDEASDTLYAYSSDGTQLWSNSSLVVAGGDTLAVGEDGALYSLTADTSPAEVRRIDPDTGDVVWNNGWSAPTGFQTTALDDAENLYVSDDAQNIRRYNTDGTVEWTQSFSSNATIVAGGDGYIYAFIGSSTPEVEQLDVTDGSTVSSSSSGRDSISTIGIDDNQNIYWQSKDSNDNRFLERYDATTDTVDWTTSISNQLLEIDVTPHGNVYVHERTTDKIDKYSTSDGSFIETVDDSYAYTPNISWFPDYAANQSVWQSKAIVSAVPSKQPSSASTVSASGVTTTGGSATTVSVSGSPFTAGSTSTTGAGTTPVAASSSPATAPGSTTTTATPTLTGTTTSMETSTGTSSTSATSSHIAVSAGMLFPSQDGDARVFKTAATTSPATPVGARAIDATATVASGASSTPTTTVTTQSGATAGLVSATTDPHLVGLTVVADGTLTKVSASSSMATSFEFEPRITALTESSNTSDLADSANRARLEDTGDGDLARWPWTE